MKDSISSCVALFAFGGFTAVVGFSLVSSRTGFSWVAAGELIWVPLTVGFDDLPSVVMGFLNDLGAVTSGTFCKTTMFFWGALGADTVVAAMGLIASVVVLEQVLVSSTDFGDAGRDRGLSSTPPFLPESEGEHFPSAGGAEL